MPAILLDLLLGFGIGLSLGLLGGGGSILTVPALVYLVGQAPQAAVTTSLAIVGANSALGALFHSHSIHRNWVVVLGFGAMGMAVSYLSAGLSRLFPPATLLAAFAVLMLVVGGLMFFNRSGDRSRSHAEAGDSPERPRWLAVFAGGAGVGLLTGLLGVGGGFLIVPALVLLVGLPMAQAVGASLVIIAANSFAGLAGRIAGGDLDLALTGVFVAAGLAGSLLGSRLAGRLPAHRLRQLFALFVVVLGVFLLADNLSKL